MNDTQKYRFSELSHIKQQNIITLLACAIRDPDHHIIHAGRSGHPKKAYGYYVELPGKQSTCGQIAEDWNLGNWLIHEGFVEHGPISWKTFRFRPTILAWYRQAYPLSDADAKAAIGKYFHELAVGDDDDEMFNPDNISVATDLPVERVVSLVRSMVGAGILMDAGRGRSFSEKRYKFTQDGHRWFSGGCRPDFSFGPSVTVNVEVHIQIDQVIHAIAELQIPEEQKRAYELTALKLQRELERDNVTWDTTKDALDMAANAKEVAVPIITLLAAHADKIMHAISQMPLL
jgi:hypothetical protein